MQRDNLSVLGTIRTFPMEGGQIWLYFLGNKITNQEITPIPDRFLGLSKERLFIYTLLTPAVEAD